VRSFGYRYVGVFSKEGVGDDLARHEAFDGVGQQDLDAEEEPAEVHQVVGPAVVLQ
jgi:hypothetical protein